MDEAAWLACDNPEPMLQLVRDTMGDRRLRLFSCACMRRGWHFLEDERSRAAIEAAERFADALITEEERDAAMMAGHQATQSVKGEAEDAAWGACLAAGVIAEAWDPGVFLAEEERGPQASLLRCIAGNPFRPASINPGWLSPTVAAIAQVAYGERALPSGELAHAHLAVLADALEEAGCTDTAILDHLRGPGPHVRGCFALDAILGRE